MNWKDFQVKDVVLLIFGFVLGIPASMIATLILGPAMTILSGFHIVKGLARARQIWHRDKTFDSLWHQSWEVVSTRFPGKNDSKLKLYRFMHLLAGEAEMKTTRGNSFAFRILAVIEKNRTITGKWMDPTEGGYYGSFQLMLWPTLEVAEGTWIGFSSDGTVKNGPWRWELQTESSDGQPL